MDNFWNVTAKDLLLAGGWFFTIFGWAVTNAQANRRELRKETRTDVDACCRMAGDLLAKARKYYASAASHSENKALAAELRFDLQRLLARVERLETNSSKCEVTGACVELMDSVTGGDFETATRPAYSFDSERLLKTESDTHLLMDQLENGFKLSFK